MNNQLNLGDISTADKIIRVKARLQDKQPFFAYMMFFLNFKSVPKGALRHDTMAIDKYGNIYYVDDFVNHLTENQLTGCLMHEVFHLAFLHLSRSKNYDKDLFNIAADLVVNDNILEMDMSLPKNGLIPINHKFNILGKDIEDINTKSAEDIYWELYKENEKFKEAMKLISKYLKQKSGSGNQKSPGSGDSCEPGESGEGSGDQTKEKMKFPVDIPGMGKLNKNELDELAEQLKSFDSHIHKDSEKRDKEARQRLRRFMSNGEGLDSGIKRMVSEAATVAKQRGLLPAGIKNMVDKILDSKISWKERLYHYISAEIISDYDWSRPSRRSHSLGIYLPDTKKENIDIVFHIDTSGSMWCEDELSQGLGELVGIIESFPNVRVTVLIGDAKLQERFELTSDNPEEIMDVAKNMTGGGGTDHNYVFKYLEEEMPEAKLLICYTDGFTSIPENNIYPFHTVWVISKGGSDRCLDFGEIIKIDE